MSVYYNDTGISAGYYNGTALTAIYYNGTKVWPNESVYMDSSSFASIWVDGATQYWVRYGYIDVAVDYNFYCLNIVLNQKVNLHAVKKVVFTGDSYTNGPFRTFTPNTYYNVYMNRTYPSGTINECVAIATSMTASSDYKTLTVPINSYGEGYLYFRLYMNNRSAWDHITSITLTN